MNAQSSITQQNSLQVVSPIDGSVVAEYEWHRDEEIEERLQRAREAFADWRLTPVSKRAELMQRIAETLRSPPRRIA